MKLKSGNKYVEGGVQMEVDGIINQIDKAKNNPLTVVKWKVTDMKSSWESKVTMNLFHTNQGVHFQGGNTNENMTTCSLAAKLFESFCYDLMAKKGLRIEAIRETLLKMDLRKKYGSQPRKQNKKIIKDDIFKCDSCHYTTVTKIELKKHLFLMHLKKPHPTAMKTVPLKTTKEPKKVDVEPDVECLECRFSCREEHELDSHMETVHKKTVLKREKKEGQLLKYNVHLNEIIRENSKLNKADSENAKLLDGLQAKEQEYISKIESMKIQTKTLIQGKENADVSYQEASKVIADMQRVITEQNEKIQSY